METERIIDTVRSEAPATGSGAGITRVPRAFSWIWRTRALGVVLVAVLLVLWELASRNAWVPTLSMPPMTEILADWWRLVLNGKLAANVGPSLWRMFAGYAIAGVLGIALGLLMGYFRIFYNLLEPLTEILRPIPSPAYIPIVILFLGIDDEMKIFMVALASFFPVLLNTYTGVQSVDPVQVQTARTFGIKPATIVRRVVLPASSPYIFTGLRVSLAIALILVALSEMVAANNGIGYFILNSQRGFQVRDMYAGVITLAAIGYGLNRLFLLVEGRVMAWHYGYTQQSRR